MQQAGDFLDESETLAAVLAGLAEGDWQRETQFKRWTLDDIVVHLHFWNRAADLSLVDPEGFGQLARKVVARAQADGSLRPIENETVAARGPALYDAWTTQYRDMAGRWGALDPKTRVKWVGPEMSVKSSITARQMETWAHGQAVFDQLGLERRDTDRIRNIVVLGVNTFGWSHTVQGLAVPEKIPLLRLRSPSGEEWVFGDADSGNRITGAAVEFAQVVTQTRNIADTHLRVEGDVATRWMATAQCFAGTRETPPVAGTRHRMANA